MTTDHPTLTDVEKAIGETLMAGRMLQHVMGVNKNEQLSGYVHMEYVDAALAERDALIMRLAGELETARETCGALAHKNILLIGASKRNLDSSKQAEADLAAMTAERDRWKTRASILCFDSHSNLAVGVRRDMYAERGAVTDEEIARYQPADEPSREWDPMLEPDDQPADEETP